MSKVEILEELPKLTKEERDEIRLKLFEMDGDEWIDDAPLSEADLTLIDKRIAAHEKDPGTAIPWPEFEARLKRRLGE